MRISFHPPHSLVFCFALTIIAGSLTAQDKPPVYTIDLYGPGESQASQLAEKSPKYQIDLFGQAVGQNPTGLVVVPALKGMTYAAASEKLAALNLKPKKNNEAGLSIDLVDYHNPKPGEKVKAGTEIGMRLVTKIPDVTGKSLGDAYALLKDAGYKVKYYREWDKDYDITGQNPRGGKTDIRGKSVTLMCNVKVPNLKGKTVAQAKKMLQDIDIYASILTNYRDSDIVLNQGHRAGKLIPRKFSMVLEPGVQVPDVTNVGVETAEQRLIRSGIPAKLVRLTKVATVNTNEHGRTLVTAQSIRRGQYIARGKTLGINVSQLVYQQLRIPECRIKPIDYGSGYQKPQFTPEQQSKCVECGQPCSRCRCFNGG